MFLNCSLLRLSKKTQLSGVQTALLAKILVSSAISNVIRHIPSTRVPDIGCICLVSVSVKNVWQLFWHCSWTSTSGCITLMLSRHSPVHCQSCAHPSLPRLVWAERATWWSCYMSTTRWSTVVNSLTATNSTRCWRYSDCCLQQTPGTRPNSAQLSLSTAWLCTDQLKPVWNYFCLKKKTSAATFLLPCLGSKNDCGPFFLILNKKAVPLGACGAWTAVDALFKAHFVYWVFIMSGTVHRISAENHVPNWLWKNFCACEV